MKKIYLAFLLTACTIGGGLNAQTSQGGLPWTMKGITLTDKTVSKVILEKPDYVQYEIEDAANALSSEPRPYRVAATTMANVNIEKSGTWSYLTNGDKIWRVQIEVEGAKAITLSWNKFTLPSGVSMYLYNQNGKQVGGAYTSNNSNQFNNFIGDDIQGSLVNIELNIKANVDVNKIQFNIDKAYAFYRGVDQLTAGYGTLGSNNMKPTAGESSSCHVNANCPAGANWSVAKNATARIFAVDIAGGGAGFCSGTLINNTSNNEEGTCKQYFLTASHCEGTNSRMDSTYSKWKFLFNYQYNECENGSGFPTNQSTVTGASFLSRSNYMSFPSTGGSIPLVGDFMLLELKNKPSAAANAYLAGWNRDLSIWNNPDYETWFGFHHPAGDVKKMSVASELGPDGIFNQTAIMNTHWRVVFGIGGTAGGSSGSGLFDQNQLLIGDLSGGPSANCDDKPFGTNNVYSKISYAWENEFDQTAFPEHAGASSTLRPWLDPLGYNNLTLGATKSDCSDMSLGINNWNNVLDQSVVVYPNPSTNGKVTLKFNFSEMTTSMKIDIINVTGAVMQSYELKNITAGQYDMNMNTLANGMYLVRIVTPEGTANKKILLNQ
jgi:lysyl endopeptidase